MNRPRVQTKHWRKAAEGGYERKEGGMSDDLDDGLGSGKRKGSGMRMIGQQAQSSRWQLAVSASKSITRQYDDVLPESDDWKAAEAVERRNEMLKMPNFGLCFAFGNKLSNFVAAMPTLEPEVAPTGRLRSYFQFPVHVLITSNPQRPLKLITLAKTTLPPQYLTPQTSNIKQISTEQKKEEQKEIMDPKQSIAPKSPEPQTFTPATSEATITETSIQTPTEKKLIEKEDTQKKTTKPSARKALFARLIDFANQGQGRELSEFYGSLRLTIRYQDFEADKHLCLDLPQITYANEEGSAYDMMPQVDEKIDLNGFINILKVIRHNVRMLPYTMVYFLVP
ncbi:hypothetical protein Tco_0515017, partial [Tanacetum coccineum]